MNANERPDRDPQERVATPTAPIGVYGTPNVTGADTEQPEIAQGPVEGLEPGEGVARPAWQPPVHVDPPPGHGHPPEEVVGSVPAGSQVIQGWPYPSREAAQVVIDTYGEPDEATPTLLTWHRAGPWKRVVASRACHEHAFPAPHTDSVASVVDYRVPPEKITPLAEFDGSVTVERTTGEVSARCHDEQANLLALNLMHDLVTGDKSVAEAREHYAREFTDFRRGRPTPYMDGLRFRPGQHTADPDTAVLSDADLRQAVAEGRQTG